MQNIYNKISPATGAHIAGFCTIQIAPIEWLVNELAIDFISGKMIADIVFIAGRNFIDIEFLPDTYDYGEKPKSGKPGSFYEVSLSGTTNSLDADSLQILNTYRYHQFICLATDRQGRQKLIGNKYEGMLLQFSTRENTDKGGTLIVSIDMNMDLQNPAPFYEVPLVQLDQPSLVATPSSATQIDCSWAAVPIATGYVLQLATNSFFTTGLVTIPTTGTSHNFTGLTTATLYYLRLKANKPGYLDSSYDTDSATTL